MAGRVASSSDSALAERLRKAEAEIERVRNLEQRLKEAEAKNKKMEELEERLKQREAESQTVAERLEQAERDAKKARKEAENTRDAVEKSGINVGDQVYAASDAKAGSSKNDLDARIAHLEVNMGHVTEALAVLPQTPPHDSGTRGARERLLFGDAKESERPAPSIQEPDLVANNLYESLVRTLTERLEEYQKRSSLDPQRRASISCIMAIKTGFTRENISGVKRLNEFLG
ncbi:MAG: hypothetical protein M1561_04575, partial [Gammaproteobacteria bacterium]|nr:hypothetical protein [Gammaproteobacteria bacterium]